MDYSDLKLTDSSTDSDSEAEDESKDESKDESEDKSEDKPEDKSEDKSAPEVQAEAEPGIKHDQQSAAISTIHSTTPPTARPGPVIPRLRLSSLKTNAQLSGINTTALSSTRNFTHLAPASFQASLTLHIAPKLAVESKRSLPNDFTPNVEQIVERAFKRLGGDILGQHPAFLLLICPNVSIS